MNTRHPWQQTEIIPSQTSILKHIFEILANEFNQWYAGKLICSIYQFPSCKYFNLAHFKGTISSQKPVPVNSSTAAETVETSSVLQSCWTLYDLIDCSITRLPCPSPAPGACSNSCALSWWCHPTISSSVVPFSSCLQSFPIRGFFNESVLCIKCQSIGVSASASVLPMNIQAWFSLGLTSWISLQSKGLSRVFSNTTVQKHQFFGV